MNKKWRYKDGTEIQNGDIINSPQGHAIPIVFVEEWNDLGALLRIFITPLNRDWEKYGLYEFVRKGEPQIIQKKDIGKMENMTEYKRDFGKSPKDVIDNIL